MDLRTWFAQSLVVPTYERRWGLDTKRLEQELSASQFFSAERIRDLQWQRIRRLVEHASVNSPFYKERFSRCGFSPGDLQSFEDLEKLPLTTKDDLRSSVDEIIGTSQTRASLFHKRTGGSTGLPVHVYWDRFAHQFKRAVTKRHDAWAGYRLGDKRAALWGDTEKSYPWSVRLFQLLCERTIYLDTLLMDERHMAEFCGQLEKHRPTNLIGHAHSLYHLSEYMRSEGRVAPSVTGVISTAETLSDSERETIESVFGPIVFDRYGCEEVSLIASECSEHDGLHISAEGLHVEVIGETTDQPGRLVVTDLVNLGMPLIRYEIGDLARLQAGTCACGRGLPRLQRVYGRVSDILEAPDGRKISGISILDTHIIHIAGIRQAQLIQDELDHLQVNVVRSSEWSEESQAQIEEVVRRTFGGEMRLTVCFVSRIEPTARGKYQFSICKISK